MPDRKDGTPAGLPGPERFAELVAAWPDLPHDPVLDALATAAEATEMAGLMYRSAVGKAHIAAEKARAGGREDEPGMLAPPASGERPMKWLVRDLVAWRANATRSGPQARKGPYRRDEAELVAAARELAKASPGRLVTLRELEQALGIARNVASRVQRAVYYTDDDRPGPEMLAAARALAEETRGRMPLIKDLEFGLGISPATAREVHAALKHEQHD